MTKIIFNKKLLYLVCLVMAAGWVTSCKKNNDAVTDKVVLLSFGPSGAKHGDTMLFFGYNLNKVVAIELPGATVAAAAFKQQTFERIALIIPQATQEGFVKLKTADSTIISKTKINFNVVVKVTSVTKQARPGDNITIKGDYLNWVKEVRFAKDIAETTFVSRTLTELVVKVPQSARTGTLLISFGGTKPLTIETDSTLIVTLPAVTSFSPSPIDRGTNLTITGTNLDLVMGVLFKGLTAPVTTFVSQTATQLVVKVPAAANKGKITLVAYSTLTVESAQSLAFVGDLPDLAPLGYAFYIDALQNGWQNWGWSSTATFNSTDNVRDGTASIKMDYTGQWGALKFANGSVSTAAYNELTFSVYGTTGSGGKKINITPSGGSTYTLTIEEGKWVEYKLTKAQIGNPATITDLTFQNQDWTGLVYIDHVGLR
ncbi:MAG: IPT/TIG domain-containing protein [Chitinophagaceae bacterium]